VFTNIYFSLVLLRAGLIIDLNGMKQNLITFLYFVYRQVWCGYQRLSLKTSMLPFVTTFYFSVFICLMKEVIFYFIISFK